MRDFPVGLDLAPPDAATAQADAILLQRLRDDHVIDMRKQALLREMRRAAAGLLVGGPGDLDPARTVRARVDEGLRRDDRGGQAPLHVAGSAAVDLPVRDRGPERVDRPSAAGLDHVGVAVGMDAPSRRSSFARCNDVPAGMAAAVAGDADGALDGCREAGPFEAAGERLADVAMVLARRIDGGNEDRFPRQRHEVVAPGSEPGEERIGAYAGHPHRASVICGDSHDKCRGGAGARLRTARKGIPCRAAARIPARRKAREPWRTLMRTMKGPALFLAQFAGDEAPFNSWGGITRWAAGHGYKGVQVPSWDGRLFDLEKAAESRDYCDEFKGTAAESGIEVTELSTHLQGQLVAVHPAYDAAFDGFAAGSVRGDPVARQAWAVDQVRKALSASRNLGLARQAAFSGALAWPYVYPWPQRPAGLVETAFDELAARWRPILDHAEDCGVDICFEIHPGEDLHDGITYEMFLERTGNHARACMLYDPSHYVLQCLDYLENIDIYRDRIRMFHVKDAEFNPTGRQGVYSGYQPWVGRAGRFRSLGDGQVDFASVFSKLTAAGFEGWAVVEWECCLKHPEDGAREGAAFVRDHIIRVTERAFDDFADGGTDLAANRKMLGI